MGCMCFSGTAQELWIRWPLVHSDFILCDRFKITNKITVVFVSNNTQKNTLFSRLCWPLHVLDNANVIQGCFYGKVSQRVGQIPKSKTVDFCFTWGLNQDKICSRSVLASMLLLNKPKISSRYTYHLCINRNVHVGRSEKNGSPHFQIFIKYL